MLTGLFRAAGLYVAACLALGGCAGHTFPMFGVGSGPLRVSENLKPAKMQPVNAREPVYILVKTYRDDRDDAPSRRIGRIKDTFVSDLHSDEVIVDDDIAALVTAAMRRQLAAGGYRVLREDDPRADRAAFVLTGRIEAFRYDVESRDKVDMQVQSTLRRPRGGEVLWSGTVKEHSERFAGVMGDSRATIVHYINKGLQNVTRKTVMSISGTLARAEPDLFLQAGAPVSGVTVEVAPRARKATGAERGLLAIGTEPESAQVYIGDVYYGTAPLKLHLAPGIYTVRLVAKGYPEVTQKVSVRAGETTTWDATMKK